jgi:hypothetical protein
MMVDAGVIQVKCWEDNGYQRLCALQLALQSLDILRGSIAPSVRRLVVSALCAMSIYTRCDEAHW